VIDKEKKDIMEMDEDTFDYYLDRLDDFEEYNRDEALEYYKEDPEPYDALVDHEDFAEEF